MKKISIFESTDSKDETTNYISKYRLETLSDYLGKYQDLKHAKRNANTKSDADYLENKIGSVLRKINKFSVEFGSDFLKNKLKESFDTDSFSVVLDESIQHFGKNSEPINENETTEPSTPAESIPPQENVNIPKNVNTFPNSDITSVLTYIGTKKLKSINENNHNIESIAIDIQLKTKIDRPFEFFYDISNQLLKSDYNNSDKSEIHVNIDDIDVCFNPIGDHVFVEIDGTDDFCQINKSKIDEIKKSVNESVDIIKGDTITLINKNFGKINVLVGSINEGVLNYKTMNNTISGTIDISNVNVQRVYLVDEKLLKL